MRAAADSIEELQNGNPAIAQILKPAGHMQGWEIELIAPEPAANGRSGSGLFRRCGRVGRTTGKSHPMQGYDIGIMRVLILNRIHSMPAIITTSMEPEKTIRENSSRFSGLRSTCRK